MIEFVVEKFFERALKPKPRTVKQIELDENLRPKVKSTGKETEARAAKKK